MESMEAMEAMEPIEPIEPIAHFPIFGLEQTAIAWLCGSWSSVVLYATQPSFLGSFLASDEDVGSVAHSSK